MGARNMNAKKKRKRLAHKKKRTAQSAAIAANGSTRSASAPRAAGSR